MPGSRSMEGRMQAVEDVLNNVLSDPGLLSALSAYGYDAERMQQGKALRETALALYHKQKVERDKLASAIQAGSAAKEKANAIYMDHVRLIRIVFRDDPRTLKRLGLAGPPKKSRGDKFDQMGRFYFNILTDPFVLSTLAEYNLTKDKLEVARKDLDAVQASNRMLHCRKIDAQVATKARDKALATMDAWMRNFRMIGRLALKGQPQYLEKISMSTPSEEPDVVADS